MTIPQANLKPALRATEKQWRANLRRVFERAQFILGDELRAFEDEFAAHEGARYAVGVSSGTAAIELALRVEQIQGEVLTSALTAPFTAVAIRAAGCTPRFADVNPETLQMEAKPSRQTRAVVAVHLYGQPCNMRGLGVPVIQDACQAHGARIGETPLTKFSKCVAYSFYPTKNLGCLGDGGAILTNNASIARKLRMMRDGGRRGDQVSHVVGFNARLDEIQCCFLRAFLPRLDEWNAHRARIAAIYDNALAGCAGVRVVQRSADSVNHLYVIRAERRDRLRVYLAQQEIGSGVHYPVALHRHPAFLQKISLPHAEQAVREVLSLPLWPYLKESDARRVASSVRKFYRL